MNGVVWLLIIGAAFGAWAALSVLCAERQRRVQAVDVESAARRQSALREAERLAARARKQDAAAVAGGTAVAPPAGTPSPAGRKPAN